jgi:hypothetical protein
MRRELYPLFPNYGLALEKSFPDTEIKGILSSALKLEEVSYEPPF